MEHIRLPHSELLEKKKNKYLLTKCIDVDPTTNSTRDSFENVKINNIIIFLKVAGLY